MNMELMKEALKRKKAKGLDLTIVLGQGDEPMMHEQGESAMKEKAETGDLAPESAQEEGTEEAKAVMAGEDTSVEPADIQDMSVDKDMTAGTTPSELEVLLKSNKLSLGQKAKLEALKRQGKA